MLRARRTSFCAVLGYRCQSSGSSPPFQTARTHQNAGTPPSSPSAAAAAGAKGQTSMIYFGSGSGGEWIGWRRWRDVALFFGSISFIFATYFGVEFFENQQKVRRHHSIERDIERELWRARELGLVGPAGTEDVSSTTNDESGKARAVTSVDDDGFADKYLDELKAKRAKGWNPWR